MNNPSTPLLPTTRREFLRLTGSGLGLLAFSAYAPAFLTRAAAANVPAPQRDRRILVLVQLAGGNDGLNTVIPFTDSAYYRLRPNLGLRDTPGAPLPRINSHLAFHPACAPLAEMLKEGKFAIIQNVGYPNPNRSHFRSTEIWETASDADSYLRDGWVGRYLDNCCGGPATDLPPAAPAGRAPLAVHGGAVLPTSFLASKPQTYFGLDALGAGRGGARRGAGAGGRTAATPPPPAPTMAPEMDQLMMMPAGNAGNNQPLMPGADGPARRGRGFLQAGRPGGRRGRGSFAATNSNELLEDFAAVPAATDAGNYLSHTLMDALVTERRVQQIIGAYQTTVPYPGSPLAQSLRRVASLIAANLGTRVYFVSLGGFDNHANQLNPHQRLLGELSGALVAFQRDLDRLGLGDQVLTMTFSEFGRRPYENVASGTDHGTAAPLFVMGSTLKVKDGLIGTPPSLDVPERGDLAYKIDFRQVYATVLHQWLGADPGLVLSSPYQELPIFGEVAKVKDAKPVKPAAPGPSSDGMMMM